MSGILLGLFASGVEAVSSHTDSTSNRHGSPLVGAIRWDAWHVPVTNRAHGGEGGPVRAMERSLGPAAYHFRLPFFAKVLSSNEVRIGGYTQEIVDREIAFAKAGGLDYWAFLLYEEGDAMSQGLALYRSSARRADIGFCAIASPPVFRGAAEFTNRMPRVLRLMAEPGYVKVMGNRPLLYVFDVDDKWIGTWGGPDNARRLFDGLRAAARYNGLGDPYLVVLDPRPEEGRRVAGIVGAEALSAYAAGGHVGRNGQPYADLAAYASNFWERCAATGLQVVPLAMAGWDRRPRIEHPVPWEAWQKPGEGMDRYFALPAPRELAAHIEDARRWAAARPGLCPAQAVLVYAWNEHDEGGWLCPTLAPDGSADTSRLDALAAGRKRRP